MIEVRILGPLEVRIDGQAIDLGTPQQRLLFALLVLARNRAVSTDTLIDRLWPDEPPAAATKTVQVYVSRLRQALGPDAARLDSAAGGYRLQIDDDELDAARFKTGFDLLRSAGSSMDAASLRSRLADLLGAWTGDPLQNVIAVPAVRREAERLDDLRMQAQEELFDATIAGGEAGAVVAELRAATTDHPERERLWGQLMRALYADQRQTEALAAYGEAHRQLTDLGLDVTPGIQALQLAILRHELVVPARQPEAPSQASRSNVIEPISSFVGREADVAAVAALVGTHRLTTVTGPGGIGKTRLAMRVATTLGNAYGDGVWFVDLAPVGDASGVLSALASTLSVPERPDRALSDSLVEHLANRHTLLVLDNFEHVLAAAPAVAEILKRCAGVAVLATSRERLRLQGEHAYPLASLELPGDDDLAGPDDLQRFAAAQLFIERARQVEPGFQVTPDAVMPIAAICARLDGLPLAIELAAARIQLMNPPAMLSRLEARVPLLGAGVQDAPERQKTLQSTIGWSYGLLAPAEARLFRRLSVFAGAFTLDAAEFVNGPDSDALDLLVSLLDKSLLTRVSGDDARFRFLALVHEFAVAELEASGDALAARMRHAAFVAEFVTAAAATVRTPAEATWGPRIDEAFADIRVALEWASTSAPPGDFVRFAADATTLFRTRARGRDCLEWSERALAKESERTAARAQLLRNAGAIAVRMGDPVRGLALIQECIGIWREVDGQAGLAGALRLGGGIAIDLGDIVAAKRLLAEAEALARATGDGFVLTEVINDLGELGLMSGDWDGAERQYVELARLAVEGHDLIEVLIARNNQAFVVWLRGDMEKAERLTRSALAYAEEIEDTRFTGNLHGMLATILAMTGRTGEARDHAITNLAAIRASGSVYDFPVTIDALADVETRDGDPAMGLRLICAARQFRTRHNLPSIARFPPLAAYVADIERRARAAMTELHAEAVWDAASSTPPEEIVNQVLARSVMHASR